MNKKGNSMEEEYLKLKTKILNNINKLGHRVYEYPGDDNGQYFDLKDKTIRPLNHIYVWTPSFFTGMELLIYKDFKELKALEFAKALKDQYQDKVFNHSQDTMHDLGFTYTLYSCLLFELTKEQVYLDLSLKAAKCLSARYCHDNGFGYIRAWGRMDNSIPSYVEESIREDNFFKNSACLAIIDCMMNLPLLFWASEKSGDKSYYEIAVNHATSTMQNFIREDYSLFHAFNFKQRKEFNDCGYSLGSHWARGTAWAIYGFAIAYSYTKDTRYKECAKKLLEKYLSELEQRNQILPVWDFRLPKKTPALYCGKKVKEWDITKEENTKYNIDTSAAIIICNAIEELIELNALTGLEEKRFKAYQVALLDLILKDYVNYDSNVPGILKYQNGNASYTCYGDYFLIQLLSYKAKGYYKIW